MVSWGKQSSAPVFERRHRQLRILLVLPVSCVFQGFEGAFFSSCSWQLVAHSALASSSGVSLPCFDLRLCHSLFSSILIFFCYLGPVVSLISCIVCYQCFPGTSVKNENSWYKI
ncbi:hypothetical protein Bca4012_082069 [Brassica carinata]